MQLYLNGGMMFNLDLGSHLSFAVHGGGFASVSALVDSLLSHIEHLIRLSPGQLFAELMPGIAALENVHPMLVHFPIALLTLFFICDALGWLLPKSRLREVASWLLYFGTGFAAITVLAGLRAAATVAHGDDVHEIMEHHEHLGISVLSLAAILSSWRFWSRDSMQGVVRGLHLAAAGFLTLLLAFTADLGGLMVYGFGVAVKPASDCQQEAAAIHQHAGDIDSSTPANPPAEAATTDSGVAPGEAPKASVHTHADGHQHVHKHHH